MPGLSQLRAGRESRGPQGDGVCYGRPARPTRGESYGTRGVVEPLRGLRWGRRCLAHETLEHSRGLPRGMLLIDEDGITLAGPTRREALLGAGAGIVPARLSGVAKLGQDHMGALGGQGSRGMKPESTAS